MTTDNDIKLLFPTDADGEQLDSLDAILDMGGDTTGEPPAAPRPAAAPEAPDQSDQSDESDESDESDVSDLSDLSEPSDSSDSSDLSDPSGLPAGPAAVKRSEGRSLKQFAPDDKPREKALKHGIESLTDTELLAILLGSGIPGKPVTELARELLYDNGNRLGALSRQSIPALMKRYKGLGLAKATLLVAAMTFGARAQADLAVEMAQILSSDSAYQFMRPRLERLNSEEFWVMHLSRANRVMATEQISRGGVSQTIVDIRLVAKSVIERLASGVILVHNHPSGNLQPSVQDDTITRRISEGLALFDVKVLDHIIIGPNGYYSYRDNGKL